MFGIGLSLTIEEFKHIVIHPRGLIAGLISQMIILPLIAFTIAHLTEMPRELKVGLIIIAACPGGATSNLITYLLRGNVALSISLTTVNSFLTLLTVPVLVYTALWVFMGAGQAVNLPLIPTVLKIFYITLLPAILGILVRYKRRDFALRLEKPLRYILPLIYLVIYVAAIIGSKIEKPREILGEYIMIIPWAVLLNIVGMLLGYTLARILRFDNRNQITLTVEVGIQNSALAITIASSAMFLNNFTMAIPGIVYGFFTFTSAILFGLIIKRRESRSS